jgi:2Fe-2S ferredoxin
MSRVRFLPEGLEVEVAPGTSLLEAAEAAGARVGSACGGHAACSTCHVHVRRGRESLSPMDEPEEDALDQAFDVRPASRLACQARVGAADVEAEVTPESRRAWLDEHPESR